MDKKLYDLSVEEFKLILKDVVEEIVSKYKFNNCTSPLPIRFPHSDYDIWCEGDGNDFSC